MSWVLQLVNNPVAYRLGWVLIHSLWQGAVVAFFFGLLRAVLRGRSADTRYLVGCLMLAILAVAPVVTFFCASPGLTPGSLPDWGVSWSAFDLPQRAAYGPSAALQRHLVQRHFSTLLNGANA